ncbi:hypothetical protein [Pseudomonas sp. Leaf127]|uniref:hypothetical protein n=1 Tax=Pseudomonas sp. Leaf127 TaxID=1736267 RepID=UPI001F360212|nr:hypothetical protein [Pseudomonas sp. Leaf127]
MNTLIAEYQRQGYVLTVRQLYYQLVARDLIENTLQSYKRVAGLINDAKLAGRIDWDAIEDRTREFVTNNHWELGSDITGACASQFKMDMWANQDFRVFVIIEKEALVGVLSRLCRTWDVPILAARGYPSGTVLREFAERHLLPAMERDQCPMILHLGDHDPSGIDMTRDLQDRICLFTESGLPPEAVNRIALTRDQIDEVRPPENPAKTTDSRFASYRKLHGSSSWELDALNPAYLNGLVETHLRAAIDQAAWEARQSEVDRVKTQLAERHADQLEVEANESV